MKLKELEHEYIKEFEKQMYSVENRKAFDDVELEQIDQEIDKLDSPWEYQERRRLHDWK